MSGSTPDAVSPVAGRLAGGSVGPEVVSPADERAPVVRQGSAGPAASWGSQQPPGALEQGGAGPQPGEPSGSGEPLVAKGAGWQTTSGESEGRVGAVNHDGDLTALRAGVWSSGVAGGQGSWRHAEALLAVPFAGEPLVAKSAGLQPSQSAPARPGENSRWVQVATSRCRMLGVLGLVVSGSGPTCRWRSRSRPHSPAGVRWVHLLGGGRRCPHRHPRSPQASRGPVCPSRAPPTPPGHSYRPNQHQASSPIPPLWALTPTTLGRCGGGSR